jgi:hypothetical protein
VFLRILHVLLRWGDSSWHAWLSMSEDLCAFTSIPPLAVVVLWLGATSLDSFGDLAYCDLRGPMRGLHGD